MFKLIISLTDLKNLLEKVETNLYNEILSNYTI